jgi:putative transposase
MKKDLKRGIIQVTLEMEKLKKVITKDAEFEIDISRDRENKFELQIIKKYQRRFDGFDDKILSMYARRMTNREIQGYLQEIYNVEVSPDLISSN